MDILSEKTIAAEPWVEFIGETRRNDVNVRDCSPDVASR